MKRLGRDHHIYVLDPEAEPAITIDSGEEIIVETWDAFEGERDPDVLDAKHLKAPPPARYTSMALSLATPCAWSS